MDNLSLDAEGPFLSFLETRIRSDLEIGIGKDFFVGDLADGMVAYRLLIVLILHDLVK